VDRPAVCEAQRFEEDDVGREGIGEVVLTVDAPVSDAEVPDLCAAVERLLAQHEIRLVTCDIGAIVDPDLATLDAVARMALAARRVGASIEFRNACPGLLDLLELAGLTDVVRLVGRTSGVEVGRQAEDGEQRLGVEEEVEADDLAF
jgi:hypothetical protein